MLGLKKSCYCFSSCYKADPRGVVLINDDLEIWRDVIITRMAQMEFSMSMDTTNESHTGFLYMDVQMASPEKLYGSKYVEQTVIKKSKQVSIYKLRNIINIAYPKFRQTVEQKTGFQLSYSVLQQDQLLRIVMVVLHRTKELRTGGRAKNAYIFLTKESTIWVTIFIRNVHGISNPSFYNKSQTQTSSNGTTTT